MLTPTTICAVKTCTAPIDFAIADLCMTQRTLFGQQIYKKSADEDIAIRSDFTRQLFFTSLFKHSHEIKA